MHHFFVNPDQVKGRKIEMTGADVNHLKNVLRIKPGEEISISDGGGRKYYCQLEEIRENGAEAVIISEEKPEIELSSSIYLFQGLPKGDKMEWIVQKAVELGAFTVIPVATKRSVVKLDNKKAARKVERWNAIAESAAKQSGRGILPKVEQMMKFQEALEYAMALDMILIPYELADNMKKTRKVIAEIEPGQSVGVFIGPEGGFAVEEIKAAVDCGAETVTLGKRILRTETAGLTLLSILMYHLES